MHVVGHQAPAPDCDTRPPCLGAEQVPVERAVAVHEKDRSTVIAALGDMMGNSGDDNAGHAGHAFMPT